MALDNTIHVVLVCWSPYYKIPECSRPFDCFELQFKIQYNYDNVTYRKVFCFLLIISTYQLQLI